MQSCRNCMSVCVCVRAPKNWNHFRFCQIYFKNCLHKWIYQSILPTTTTKHCLLHITQHRTQQAQKQQCVCVCRLNENDNKKIAMCLLCVYVICRDLLKDFHGRFISIWNDLNSSFLLCSLLCDKLNLLSCTQTHAHTAKQHCLSVSRVHPNKMMFTSQQTMMMHHRNARHKTRYKWQQAGSN